MKTAVIYARYSSDSQTEQSIEGQLRVCEEYAKNHNILILDTYIDRAMTGTNDNRPDFQRMLKDSAKRQWNYILVYKLDRFSRNKYETAIHKKTLKDNGVKVLSAMENIPDTPEGIILESLLEGMNQYYSAELSQKVKRGMNETRIKGNFTGGYLLYGYEVKDKKVVINENQAEVIRFIYGQYAKGVYVKDIIKELTDKGILNHGKPFARNTVYNILKNEKYSGVYKYKGQIFDNIYPQIVGTELFEKVRKLIDKNKYGKRSTTVNYLLRHKIKCGYCGQSISAESGTAKNGQVKHYYKCLGRKHNNGCKKSTVRKDFLEQIVIDTVIEQLSRADIIDCIIKGLIDMQERKIQQNSALTYLQREKKQTETSIENMLNAIERGVVTNSTTKRLKELETKLDGLERKILLEKSKQTIKLTEKEIRQFYEQALRLEPQMLINYLIKEIILFDDRIEIIFNSPLMYSPDNSQGFTFYSQKVQMPYIAENNNVIRYRDFYVTMRI